MNVIARFYYPENGRDSDIRNARSAGLKPGEDYTVRDIMMGQSSTSVYLDGFDHPFNSVQFTFFENKQEIDIFRDARFNPYIRS